MLVGLFTVLLLRLLLGLPQEEPAWDRIFEIAEQIEERQASSGEAQQLYGLATSGMQLVSTDEDFEELALVAETAARYLGAPDHEAAVVLRRAYRAHAGGTGEALEILEQAIARIEGATHQEINLRALLVKILCGHSRWEDAQRQLVLASERLVELRPEQATEFWYRAEANYNGAAGFMMQFLGLLDRAMVFYGREQVLAEALGGPELLAENRLHRLDILLQTERFQRAMKSIRDTKDQSWFASIESRTQLAFSLGEAVAQSELEREEPSRSRIAADLFSGLWKEKALDARQKLLVCVRASELALRVGELDQAEAWLERAQPLHQQLKTRSAEFAGQDGALLTTQEIRLRLARKQLAPKDHERMAEVFDSILEEWKAVPHRPGGIGFLHSGDRRQIVSTAIRVILEGEARDKEEAALDMLLRAEAFGSLARGMGAANVNTKVVRERLLQPEHGILYYLPARERTHLFVIDATEVRHIELASSDVIRQQTASLNEALARRPEGVRERWDEHLATIEASAKRMGQALLPSELHEDLQSWKRLTTLGLGFFKDPRIELAPLEKGRVGELLAVDRLTSLALGVALGDRLSVSGEGGLLLLENTDPGEALASKSQVQQIRFRSADRKSLLGAFERSEVISGSDLTLEALSNREFEPWSVTHWILHGSRRYEYERSAGLLIEPSDGHDGFLSASQIEEHIQVNGIVILSACGSGQGQVRYGDDKLTHLGGAFLRAGARAVIISRARIEYGATVKFMEEVHGALARGDSPAEALRTARVAVSARGGFLGAFYMTQFDVVGRGQDAQRP